MRKVIQAFPFLGAIHALCDDGTLWALEGGQWNKLVPIPQEPTKVDRTYTHAMTDRSEGSR